MDDLDNRLAELPIAEVVALIDGMTPRARLFLGYGLEGHAGTFSQMLAIALRENRKHGTDIGEALRCQQDALRIDAINGSSKPLRERIRSLRPPTKETR